MFSLTLESNEHIYDEAYSDIDNIKYQNGNNVIQNPYYGDGEDVNTSANDHQENISASLSQFNQITATTNVYYD